MPKQTSVIHKLLPQPRQLRIDSTTQCNASCFSCHRFLSKRKGQMPMDLIEQILSDVSKWVRPLEELVPVDYGEFFTRKDWYEILQVISDALPQTNIVIPTNGALLSNERIDLLCKIPTIHIINFSINAFYDETYEAFTGLSYIQLHKMEGRVRLIKNTRPDIECRFSMIADPEYVTDWEKDMFKWFWSRYGSVWMLPAASAGRDKKPFETVKLPCRSIFSDFVVGFDGKLSSCCFDSNFSLDLDFYSGDLLKDWTNPQLTRLRELHNKHERDKYSICASCTFS